MVPSFKQFHEHACNDAEDLLGRVRPKLQRDRPGEFIYRGVGDASYGLVPGALRAEELVKRRLDPFQRVQAEFQTLRNFVEGCDLGGSQVPHDTKETSTLVREVDSAGQRILVACR